jgi:hypothetical protein
MNPLGRVDGANALTVGHTGPGGAIMQRWLPGCHHGQQQRIVAIAAESHAVIPDPFRPDGERLMPER